MIKFIFNLINYFEKSKKHGKFWTYGIYLWQNNICHGVWNFDIYFKIRVVDAIFGWICFMVYDIDIHQLNIGQF